MTRTKDPAGQKDARFVEDEIIESATKGIQRLPILEEVFSRLANDLTSTLKSGLGLLAEVDMGDMAYTTWGNMIDELDAYEICAPIHAVPWGTQIMACMDPTMFYTAYEQQFSGDPAAVRLPRRNATTIEKRTAKRFFDVVLRELAQKFAKVSPVTFSIDNVETRQQAASMQSGHSSCVVVEFIIRMGEVHGKLKVICPIGALEPVRAKLLRPYFADVLDSEGGEEWREALQRRVKSGKVEIQAVLKKIQIPISEIVNWEPGALIDLDMAEDPDHEITVTCSGVPIFHAITGNRRGALAMRITRDYSPQSAIAADVDEMEPGQGYSEEVN